MRFNLSEIKELIETRRTIKPENYTERLVHKELIEDILDSARWAPNHGMTQPWFFKVYLGKGLEKLRQSVLEGAKNTELNPAKIEKFCFRLSKTSVAIAICHNRQSERIPKIEEVSAIACAVQNMHLMATAYGLGAFWSTGSLAYSEIYRNILGLVEGQECLGTFFMGYPGIDWPTSQRKPVEYYTSWNEGD
ncbi:MAG: nitroreductase [Flavobacteriales bacterium]|nr:nitroreductase [Flavobacteriales bacterium]